jgi:regulator of protease activity HflC (stomatin/prohibitin superfamily)
MATSQNPFNNVSVPNVSLIKWIVIAVVGLYLLKSSIIFVPPGHAGVVYDRGRGVLPSPMKEGLNFAIPFWQTVTFFDTRLQEYTMSILPDEGALARDDSLDAPTSDGQTVKVDATVLFRVEAQKTPQVFQGIGINYVDKLIRPFSRSQIRMVISL